MEENYLVIATCKMSNYVIQMTEYLILCFDYEGLYQKTTVYQNLCELSKMLEQRTE